MPDLRNTLAKTATSIHVAVLRGSKGKIAGHIGPTTVCVFTSTGRTSGKQRSTPLGLFDFDGQKLVVASNGGSDSYPAWYHNVRAHPEVTVEADGTTSTYRARVATPDERARYWPKVVAQAPNFGTYETKTDRQIPIVLLDAR